jgi:hypothetical protein
MEPYTPGQREYVSFSGGVLVPIQITIALMRLQSIKLRTVFGTIIQALRGKDHKKVELNAAAGVERTLI